LNCYEGPSIWKLHVRSGYTVSLLFLYIINDVLSAVSKMLCILILLKVPKHTEYCIFVLYCIVLGQECGVWSVVDSCVTGTGQDREFVG